MLLTASLALLGAVGFAATGPSFENIGQSIDLFLVNSTTEACEYDAVNDKWMFVAHDFLPNSLFGTGFVASLPGSYPMTDGGFMDLGDAPLSLTGATAFVSDTQMFIAQAAPSSVIGVYNTEDGTSSLVDTITLPILGGTFYGANGMCYDDVRDILYVTNLGIDLFGLTGVPNAILTASVTKITGPASDSPVIEAMDMTNVLDQNGNSTQGLFRPNGCTVADDGKAYFVAFGASPYQALGIYDADTEQFVVTTIPGANGDGLIAIDNYLVTNNWGTPGGLGTAGEATGYLSYYDLDEFPEGEFKTVITGLESPSDMGYNSKAGVICVPSFVFGSVDFIQFTAPTPSPTYKGYNLYVLIATLYGVDTEWVALYGEQLVHTFMTATGWLQGLHCDIGEVNDVDGDGQRRRRLLQSEAGATVEFLITVDNAASSDAFESSVSSGGFSDSFDAAIVDEFGDDAPTVSLGELQDEGIVTPGTTVIAEEGDGANYMSMVVAVVATFCSVCFL